MYEKRQGDNKLPALNEDDSMLDILSRSKSLIGDSCTQSAIRDAKDSK